MHKCCHVNVMKSKVFLLSYEKHIELIETRSFCILLLDLLLTLYIFEDVQYLFTDIHIPIGSPCKSYHYVFVYSKPPKDKWNVGKGKEMR